MLQLSCNKMYVTLSVFGVWLASSSRTRDGIKLPQELSVMIYVNTGITLLHFQCKSSVQFLTLLQNERCTCTCSCTRKGLMESVQRVGHC